MDCWNKDEKVAHLTPNVVEIDNNQNPTQRESFAVFVLLEKGEEK